MFSLTYFVLKNVFFSYHFFYSIYLVVFLFYFSNHKKMKKNTEWKKRIKLKIDFKT